jgi:hypothetical protein
MAGFLLGCCIGWLIWLRIGPHFERWLDGLVDS